MKAANKVLSVAGAAVGVAAAGTALRVAQRRAVISRRGAGDETVFGSLRSAPITVVADDGVPLHVEVDDYVAATGRRRATQVPELTVVTNSVPVAEALHRVARDDLTVVLIGGVRTPFIDVPDAAYFTNSPGPGNCREMGHKASFDAAKISEVYGNRKTFASRFSETVDRLVKERWLTEGDAKRLKQSLNAGSN